MLVLLVGSVVVASSGQEKIKNDDAVKKITEKIKKDLEKENKYSEKDLELLIDLLQDLTKTKPSKEERKMVKNYIIAELKKDIKNKQIRQKLGHLSKIASVKPKISVSSNYRVYSIAPLVYVGPSHFAQPWVDITGGSGYDDAGNPYNIDGNNDLINVDIESNPPYYTVFTYTLTFKDEDHPDPTLNSIYDKWRLIEYGRIEDIETFYAYASGSIVFIDIWSNDKTFAYWWGSHGDNSFPGVDTVYIAVWNHAFDVDDDNPSLSKKLW